ncbi:alpha/beta fold hydrolase [Fictibacillus halophilus]
MIHRPGIGNSEIGSEERHTYQLTNELNELLRKLNIEEKVILVGHSYGANFMPAIKRNPHTR